MTNVQTKEHIFGLLRQNYVRLKDFGVKRCGVFGSFVRGEPDQDSDIDILVEFEPGQKTFDNFMHLAFFLEDALQCWSGWLTHLIVVLANLQRGQAEACPYNGRFLVASAACSTVAVDRKVDLVTLESLSPYIRPHILREVEYTSR